MIALAGDVADQAFFPELTARISRECGIQCESYKDKCLKRRIAVRMRAYGISSYEQYARLLLDDPSEPNRLLETLTINITRLFRDWATYQTIAERIVPDLWTRPGSRTRVWSAGCASGEEAYSLAILFHRHATTLGEMDRLARLRILGTDIDRPSLLAAERGTFGATSFADTPADVRSCYFTPTSKGYAVVPEIRPLVGFERRDLLRLPPAGLFDLIVCRNVLIYFDRAAQEDLLQRFRHALIPGGFLVLGKVETLFGPARDHFTVLDPRERLFQRKS